MYRIGIDLGGTKIEGIVLDEKGGEIHRKRIPTEQEQGYEHIVRNIVALYRECTGSIAEAGHTFGIGTPGAVSRVSGTLKNCNATCLNGRPLKKDIETLDRLEVSVQNEMLTPVKRLAPSDIEFWFRATATDEPPSLGQRLREVLAEKEVERIRSLLHAKLDNSSVGWKTAVAYIAVRKKQ